MKFNRLYVVAGLVAWIAVSVPFEASARTARLAVQEQAGVLFSGNQLDNLMAPVALYPDPLLAQLLPAATFPDQLAQASHWRTSNSDPRGIDAMPWDVSVKAIAHYPSVLNRMSSNPDWTVAVGQAYVDQPDDVMASVQRLRAMARAEGNLVSNQQQQVLLSGGYIQIDPIQPQYIYVPVYNPAVVYVSRGGASMIEFGGGLAIGAWLNYDLNWGQHRVYYTGWQGGGWIARSRPNVQITNVYVNNTYTNVAVNRTVVNQTVNYNNLNRQPAVHANVNYNNVAAARAAAPVRSQPAAAPPAVRTAPVARPPAAAANAGRAAPTPRAPEAAPAPRAAQPAPRPASSAPVRPPAPAPARATAPERTPAASAAPRAATPERAPAPTAAPRAAAPAPARTAAPAAARAAAPARPAPAPAKPAPAKEPAKEPAKAPERGGGGI